MKFITKVSLTAVAFSQCCYASVGLLKDYNGAPYVIPYPSSNEDACRNARNIGYNGANPCESGQFQLSNGYNYYFAYCGTSAFSLYNGDGSYNHKCGGANQKFYCNGPEGQFTYHMEWLCWLVGFILGIFIQLTCSLRLGDRLCHDSSDCRNMGKRISSYKT